MKKFVNPEMEEQKLEVIDVITTSGDIIDDPNKTPETDED